MDLTIVLKGILLGLSIAAPVGPIGILCIRRTLADGRLIGFASGLGAATADALYGSVAAFGITMVSGTLVSQQTWLRLIGGTFLCYLGIRAFLARASENAAPAERIGIAAAYGSTLLLTITNPMTIISFAAIFAGMGVSASGDYAGAAALVAGVFLGSAAWWFLLSGGVSLFRTRLNILSLRWVNRISGFILTGFGVLALLSLGV